MVSDSIINASIPNSLKDFGKKKRANRSAKLKQCKLDARREQWLSQVKNRDCKENVNGIAGGGGGGGDEFNGPKIGILNRTPSVEDIHHDSDSELSPANSPTSSILSGSNSGSTYTVSSSSSSSSSSFSSRGCYSGSITEEEEGGGGGGGGDGGGSGGGCGDDDDDDGCLDDWEAMADALAADDKHSHSPSADVSPRNETGLGLDSTTPLIMTSHGNVDPQEEKSKSEIVGIYGKAWRSDDAFRPQCLPNLSKQRSFPANSERHSRHLMSPWVHKNMASCVPTSCPICCEDLDLTDSNFLPCPCGFRLCLFCHKRILEDDGRCPGCRKPYALDPVEKETSVSGGSLTIRLGRSISMLSSV